MTNPDDQIFTIGDKIVRVDRSHNRGMAHNYAIPRCGIVYCVSDCWETVIGWQCWLVGWGPTPIITGLKTGWSTAPFRKVSEAGHPAICNVNEESITP